MKDICFGVEIPQAISIQLSDEPSAYKWCTYDEMYSYINREPSRLSFEKLVQSIE
ncbi:hypothetical protein HNO89_004037 [Sporosarcina luteola]|nr:hypothetical protein [Sporosarcina luteola]